ncbi:hypothetical protein K3U93_00365 [Mycobacterium malmoense]|uniref:hypothetical protein n=1 Tax=Mycobacterium malmoense TaxID=1780 RepID=UPI00111C8E77|nr:hypothetical protein [Mycobacterium malmoense]QZA17756.1 hypothetical protein K3U93_00365 [Mycobacterium malmoense]UNB94536.1 hypothetical protein H5T25_00370 [Mycobacterium malmoense]
MVSNKPIVFSANAFVEGIAHTADRSRNSFIWTKPPTKSRKTSAITTAELRYAVKRDQTDGCDSVQAAFAPGLVK